MSTWPILSLLVFLPVGGIAFLALTGRADAQNDRNARDVTLWTSLANLALAIVLALRFDPAQEGFQFVEHAAWLPELGVAYHVGVDGISVLFILLTPSWCRSASSPPGRRSWSACAPGWSRSWPWRPS